MEGRTSVKIARQLAVLAGVLLVIAALFVGPAVSGASSRGAARKRNNTNPFDYYPARNSWSFPGRHSVVGYDEFIGVQNPYGRGITISFQCTTDDGRRVLRGLYLAPRSYSYVNLHQALGDVQYDSLELQSKDPVRASRYTHSAVAVTHDGDLPLRNAVAAGLAWKETKKGPVNRREVALTFDVDGAGVKDGNTVAAAVAVLDALKATNAHCTFFVTGKFVEAYPDVVVRMAAEGHELANHSYDHPYFDTLTPDQVKDETDKTDRLVQDLTGRSTRPFFRFPFGCRNAGLLKQVQDLGYMSISWSLDPGDWKGNSGGALHASIMSRVKPGDIVLLHTDYPIQMSEAIPALVNSLRSKGLQPTTVSQLLRR